MAIALLLPQHLYTRPSKLFPMHTETILEKATIRFPGLIDDKEVEKMMRYFIIHGELVIDYNKNPQNTFLTATVSNPKTRVKECVQYFSDGPNYFSRMKFFTIPVWHYPNKCPSEVLQLWTDVRELVNKYFQEKES